ncbi:MAG: hypothetical protein JXL80_00345 [Planctomycetes bacterium]|nr:hypothetical protein [Planctomycetota bacterium]
MRELRSRFVVLASLLVVVALGLCGCGLAHLFAYPFASREGTVHVKGDYDLRADALLIFPYLGSEIQLEYPNAGLEISSFIYQELYANLKGRVRGVVNPQQVVRYQQTDLDWQNKSIQEIGREFGADKVLYIEVNRLTLMEEHSANLYRGRVKAHLQVVDVGSTTGEGLLYESDVSVVVPKDNPLGTMQISSARIMTETLTQFAKETVWKFYDHEEPGGMQR